MGEKPPWPPRAEVSPEEGMRAGLPHLVHSFHFAGGAAGVGVKLCGAAAAHVSGPLGLLVAEFCLLHPGPLWGGEEAGDPDQSSGRKRL